MEFYFFDIHTFLLASICLTTSLILLHLTLSSLLSFLNKKKEEFEKVQEEKQELTEEEKEIHDFDFNEKMKKGYLTLDEKEIFRKKFLKR